MENNNFYKEINFLNDKLNNTVHTSKQKQESVHRHLTLIYILFTIKVHAPLLAKSF